MPPPASSVPTRHGRAVLAVGVAGERTATSICAVCVVLDRELRGARHASATSTPWSARCSAGLCDGALQVLRRRACRFWLVLCRSGSSTACSATCSAGSASVLFRFCDVLCRAWIVDCVFCDGALRPLRGAPQVLGRALQGDLLVISRCLASSTIEMVATVCVFWRVLTVFCVRRAARFCRVLCVVCARALQVLRACSAGSGSCSAGSASSSASAGCVDMQRLLRALQVLVGRSAGSAPSTASSAT